MKWISIIPLRAGSKGIQNKNIKPILGKPLYRYSVDSALEAGAEKIFISTNIKEVLETSFEKKVFVQRRSENLCDDDTPMSEVISDFLTNDVGAQIKNDGACFNASNLPIDKKKFLDRCFKKILFSAES